MKALNWYRNNWYYVGGGIFVGLAIVMALFGELIDPVALDQACVDLVFHYPSEDGDDAAALIERINSRHGIHILEQAEKIGLGSREYQLVSIDEEGEK